MNDTISSIGEEQVFRLSLGKQGEFERVMQLHNKVIKEAGGFSFMKLGHQQGAIEKIGQDIGSQLTNLLALYMIIRSNEPLSQVTNDLLDIEINAADMINKIIKCDNYYLLLRGSLASILSFLQFNTGEKVIR